MNIKERNRKKAIVRSMKAQPKKIVKKKSASDIARLNEYNRRQILFRKFSLII